MSALVIAAGQAHDARWRRRLARLSPQARDAIRRSRRRYAPRERLTTAQWAERYRHLASGAKPGPYRFENQPAVRGILEAYDDPRVREIWSIKPSQFGYTQGVELNVIGRHIHLDPCSILVLFPKDPDGRRFNREKLEPAIRATKELLAIVPVDAYNTGNTWDYKGYPGGFLQLVGTNSPSNVKSTDAQVVIVCEPDDTSTTVGGEERSQGDAITLGRERIKSFPNGKLVVGGTPTVKGASAMDDGMEKTDKRRFFVECPCCGHEQHFKWAQVKWDKNALITDPVFGTHKPETARYECESCGDAWGDDRKNRLIHAAANRPDYGWRATAAFRAAAGFYLNELMSVAGGDSTLESLVRKFLEAHHDLRQGRDGKLRAFFNNQLGEAWQIRRDTPEIAVLRSRMQPYAEWSVPSGGLLVTGFVDVQRGGESRPPGLAVLLRAWGRDLESWLVYYGFLEGNVLEPQTWRDLDKLLATPIRHADGGLVGIDSLGVDSGDGMTAEAVYAYCRAHKHVGVIATKGAKSRDADIFRPASQTIDANASGRAAKYGLKPYWIGTQRAKDDIDGRLKLTGTGAGRMHVYADVPLNYFDELTAEQLVAGRGGKFYWTLPAGKWNEALDCEVGALHGAYKLGVRNFTEARWVQIETRIRQADLLREAPPAPQPAAGVPRGTEQVRATPAAGARPFTGFGAR